VKIDLHNGIDPDLFFRAVHGLRQHPNLSTKNKGTPFALSMKNSGLLDRAIRYFSYHVFFMPH
jgi:hypothetical protein